jgi:hypothetical protein
VNNDPGEPPCGNPWGPTNECAATTCRECHVGFSVKTDEALIGEQVHAWLLSITKARGVLECFDVIQDGMNNGQTPYANLTPPECQ